MLRFGRKKQQRIIVGSGPQKIVIEILEIGSQQVQLGITGPREVPVNREEVFVREFPDDKLD